MIHFVALPLIVAFATTLVGGRALDRLSPAAAARVNATLLVAVLIAAVPTFWVIAVSGLAHLGLQSSLSGWAMHVLPEQPIVSAVVGSVAVGIAVVGCVRVARVLATHRRLRCTERCDFRIVETSGVFAYTLPGPAGTIAISRGLRQRLDDAEFDVVLAHEYSHAHHRHDRFLLLALVVDAAVPLMRPATRQLRFHLERWADEDAVRATRVDRRLAARTIAKVALASTPTPAVMGIATHGVAARAGALITPPAPAGAARRALTGTAVAVTVALSFTQLHHTIGFTFHAM